MPFMNLGHNDSAVMREQFDEAIRSHSKLKKIVLAPLTAKNAKDPFTLKKYKKKYKKKALQFTEKFSSILMGDLRKSVKNLTRTQQHIPKDLEISMKKTSVYQEHILKVYGVEGEKELASHSLP